MTEPKRTRAKPDPERHKLADSLLPTTRNLKT
jgi:hypothetical protein